MFSEFLCCLFCFFIILKAFPGDTLVPNKPDALCDKPINSVVSQPTNIALFYVQRLLLCLLIIYMVHLFARHQVASLCTVSNVCCRVWLCPRTNLYRNCISIPCITHSLASFPTHYAITTLSIYCFQSPHLALKTW